MTMLRATHSHAGGRARRRAHTLVEMTASIAILAILMAGLGSAMVVASRALDASETQTSPAVRVGDSRRALDRLASDLSLATGLLEKAPGAITFTVPDRTSDGLPDQLRYAWSGAAGTPLTLAINGGTAAPLVDNVKSFVLAYPARTSGPAAKTTGPETLLLSHDDAVLGTMRDFSLDNNNWFCAFVRPALAAGAVSWELTRVELRIKRSGLNATAFVRAVSASATQAPGTTTLASVAIPTNGSSTYGWYTVNFTGVTGLDPFQGVCIVMGATVGAQAGVIEYESGGSPMTTNTHAIGSTNGGGSWASPDTATDVRIKVYGKVTS